MTEMKWQPIETAPKGGTVIVAMGRDYGISTNNRHMVICKFIDGNWIETSNWNDESVLLYLDYWMPLPPPPEDI